MEKLLKIENWKDAGAQSGAIVGGMLVAHTTTELLLKAGGLLKLEKPILPDKWYTKAAAMGLTIVGGIYVKNALAKLVLYGAAGYFAISMVNNILNSEDITPASVRDALRPFVPALGNATVNENFDARFYQRAIQMRDADAPPAPMMQHGAGMPDPALMGLNGAENQINAYLA